MLRRTLRYGVGDQIGGYHLDEYLGHGGFGKVYRAHKPSEIAGDSYAVKILHEHIELDEESLRREVVLSRKASQHPNIVRFITGELAPAGVDGAVEVLLVSEFCNRGTLRAHLGRLPVAEAIRLLVGIFRGLGFLHARSIWHRDLKPDNILLHVDPESGVRTPKIGDFDLARLTDGGHWSSRAPGTPRYMSLEALDGRYDASVDLWAIGIILHELLTGAHPFPNINYKNSSYTELRDALRTTAPTPLPETIPAHIRELATALLLLDPTRRIEETGGAANAADRLEGPTNRPRKTDRRRDFPALARPLRATFPALAVYLEAMRPIPAGTFDMGGSGFDDDEELVHSVTLSPFWLGATPVTVAVWKEYANSELGGEMPPEPIEGTLKFNAGWRKFDHPIVNVSWSDCVAFCEWASDTSGEHVTLPSEAQWEYAARGGVAGNVYPWGNKSDQSKRWGSKLGDSSGTASVYRTSRMWHRHPFGLIDMAGNVWEWCADWYDEEFYASPSASQNDIVNTFSSLTDGMFETPTRVLRGGSWNDSCYPDFCRCACRGKETSSSRCSSYGFRLSSPGP